jgi:hypothetical protein
MHLSIDRHYFVARKKKSKRGVSAMLSIHTTLPALLIAVVFMSGSAFAGQPAAPAAKMDLNTASEDSLTHIPGIGKGMARNIIAHRPYSTVNELDKAGIRGAFMMARIADWVVQPFVAAAPRSNNPGGGGYGTGDWGAPAGRRR